MDNVEREEIIRLHDQAVSERRKLNDDIYSRVKSLEDDYHSHRRSCIDKFNSLEHILKLAVSNNAHLQSQVDTLNKVTQKIDDMLDILKGSFGQEGLVVKVNKHDLFYNETNGAWKFSIKLVTISGILLTGFFSLIQILKHFV